MRRLSLRATGALALGTILALQPSCGCSTRLVSRKVAPGDATVPGIRYALPRPFLRVTPGPGGTVDVDVICLPDPDRTYAISASSILARHALDVRVERGLLRSISWSADSSPVAARAFDAAGSGGATFAARIIEELREDGAATRGTVSTASASRSGPAPRAAATAPGPVLYAIVPRPAADGMSSVSLEAVEWASGRSQLEFETTAAPHPATPQPALGPLDGLHPVLPSRARMDAARAALDRARARLRELEDGGATPLAIARAMADVAEATMDLDDARGIEFTVTATAPVSRILFEPWRTWIERREDDGSGAMAQLDAPPGDAFVPPSAEELRRSVILVAPTRIRVRLSRDFPDGEYRLFLGLAHGGSTEPRASTAHVDFTVDHTAGTDETASR